MSLLHSCIISTDMYHAPPVRQVTRSASQVCPRRQTHQPLSLVTAYVHTIPQGPSSLPRSSGDSHDKGWPSSQVLAGRGRPQGQQRRKGSDYRQEQQPVQRPDRRGSLGHAEAGEEISGQMRQADEWPDACATLQSRNVCRFQGASIRPEQKVMAFENA